MRGNPQALFGKRPTKKDQANGTSPAVDFTLRGPLEKTATRTPRQWPTGTYQGLGCPHAVGSDVPRRLRCRLAAAPSVAMCGARAGTGTRCAHRRLSPRRAIAARSPCLARC